MSEDRQPQTAAETAGDESSQSLQNARPQSGCNGNVAVVPGAEGLASGGGRSGEGGGLSRVSGSQKKLRSDGSRDEKSKVPHRRRKSADFNLGRKAGHIGVGSGYPMGVVSALLKQLHMRVLSVEEMKMLDKVSQWPFDYFTYSVYCLWWLNTSQPCSRFCLCFMLGIWFCVVVS